MKISIVILFYCCCSVPYIVGMEQRCNSINATSIYQIFSTDNQNYTLWFFGSLAIYLEPVIQYMQLANFNWYQTDGKILKMKKICYGATDDDNELCTDIKNENDTLEAPIYNSTFQFNAVLYRNGIIKIPDMQIFDGVNDELSLSLVDGRMFNPSADISCYNVMNTFNLDFQDVRINSTYCCVSYRYDAVPSLIPQSQSQFQCEQFESELAIYESSENSSNNIYAESFMKYVFLENIFEVTGNRTNFLRNVTDLELNYYLGYDHCSDYLLTNNFSCNFTLISEGIDLKLLFMFSVSSEQNYANNMIGRVTFRGNQILMEEGRPFTFDDDCQNFTYSLYENFEAETQFCCTKFVKIPEVSTKNTFPSSSSSSQTYTTTTTATTVNATTIISTTTPGSKSDSNKTLWIILGVALLLFVCLFVAICIYLFQKRQRQRRNNNNILQTIQEKLEMSPYEVKLSRTEHSKMQIPPKNVIIDFNDVLGTGSNATVYSATLKGKIPPALKEITNLPTSEYSNLSAAIKLPTNFDHDDIEQFVRELDALIILKFHPHIITFYGWSWHSEIPAIITELANTDLLTYVRKFRKTKIPLKMAISILWQISSALAYLADLKMIHRDVACRNVLLTGSNVAKLGDFGLCCHCNETFTYKASLQKQLPLKWLSIEALIDRIFSEKSDVWSFGVMAYEIFSFGAVPYPALTNIEMLEFLKNGNRLEQPEECPNEIYELMLDCWKEDPNERPEFKIITNRIGGMLEMATADYGYLSLNTMSEEEENVVNSQPKNSE